MITIPETRIRKLTIDVKDGADGPYPKGAIELRGKLTEDLARELDILQVYRSEVEEFRISRDTLCEMGDADQAHSLTLDYPTGGRALSLRTVSLHAIRAVRTDGAWILHLKSSFDSRYLDEASEFVRHEPGFCGPAALAPTQESLHFEPEPDDGGEEQAA